MSELLVVMMLFNERPGIVLRYLALCPLRGCDGPCWGSIPANFARVYGFTDSRRDGPNQREGDAGISESKRGRLGIDRKVEFSGPLKGQSTVVSRYRVARRRSRKP